MNAPGVEPEPLSPDGVATLIRAHIQTSKDVITSANIKVE